MTPNDRRRLRRALHRKAGGLLAYLLALTAALALFLGSLHSCSEGTEDVQETGVRIVEDR
ncbi:MAG: hypothetical protein AB1578_00750 [Thermodesulfobacteriota bacterium]|jgi:hypothetical protein